jgi:hypothetical protein
VLANMAAKAANQRMEDPRGKSTPQAYQALARRRRRCCRVKDPDVGFTPVSGNPRQSFRSC